MRTGIWFAGARGSVATTALTGALALREGLADPTGCVTAHPDLSGASLPAVAEHEIGEGRQLGAGQVGVRGHAAGRVGQPFTQGQRPGDGGRGDRPAGADEPYSCAHMLSWC